MRTEAVAIGAAVAVIAGLGMAQLISEDKTTVEEDPFGEEEPELQSFSSSDEMREYFEKASSTGGSASFASRDSLEMQQSATADLGASGDASSSVERYSRTNNQEVNVQEPDILKTDGSNFFYSPEQRSYIGFRDNFGIEPRRLSPVNTSVFSGLEGDFSETGSIPENGELLLSNDILTVQDREGLKAYDVSDSEEPEKEWEMDLNGSIVASRQMNESIVLVLRERVDSESPCPMPLASGSDSLTVPCNDIGYFPSENPDSDSTYNVLKISDNGEIEDSTSIVGSGSNTVVYVSTNSIYITNQESMTEAQIITGFLQEEGETLFNEDEMDRLNQILGYDISDRSKMIEIRNLIDSRRNRMDKEEVEDWQKRFENQLGNYTADNRREFTSTRITEIGTESMEVAESGEVPGRLNDQFSMDERDGRLRIATTVGADSWRIPENSANDMYVLDEQLEIQGSVQDMGIDEQIYSARFIDDKAYIVTFRRVDPFHVVDLSDPENPELKGELKLRGFSTYLHRLEENRILGIGEENRSVKAVIFDVENDNPTIEDSKVLDDYSSEINRNHHAFMLDRKHEIFFLPGDNTGYIYGYSDGLERKMEIEIQDPKRARYVNDHLYVFGQKSVAVVDEANWEKAKEVQFREEQEPEKPFRPEPVR